MVADSSKASRELALSSGIGKHYWPFFPTASTVERMALRGQFHTLKHLVKLSKKYSSGFYLTSRCN